MQRQPKPKPATKQNKTPAARTDTRIRTRSTVDWHGAPASLLEDLRQHRGRAKGARLRHLAHLGLLAEARGLRPSPDGVELLGLSLVGLGSSIAAQKPVESVAPVPPTPIAEPVVSAGLQRLTSNFGF